MTRAKAATHSLLLFVCLTPFAGATQRQARPGASPDKVSVRVKGLQSVVVNERGRA